MRSHLNLMRSHLKFLNENLIFERIIMHTLYGNQKNNNSRQQIQQAHSRIIMNTMIF